jgi:hypothetical protein
MHHRRFRYAKTHGLCVDLTNRSARPQNDRKFSKIRAGSVEPAAELAADPISLVQHMANIRPSLHHQNARQSGRSSPGRAFGRRMLGNRSDDGIVGAGLVVHARWPHRLSEPVYGQHRAGSAIDGERAHAAQVAR